MGYDFIFFHASECKRFKLFNCFRSCSFSKTFCHSEIVEAVKEFKYLGLVIDSKMSWLNHILNNIFANLF